MLRIEPTGMPMLPGIPRTDGRSEIHMAEETRARLQRLRHQHWNQLAQRSMTYWAGAFWSWEPVHEFRPMRRYARTIWDDFFGKGIL